MKQSALLRQDEEYFEHKRLEAAAAKVKTEIHHHVEAMQLAIEAAEFKARPPIIEALVGIKISTALQIYKQVNGCSAPRGQLPNEPTYYIKTPQRHMDSVWFIKTYLLLRSGGEPLAPAAVKAYRCYDKIVQAGRRERIISFDRAYYLIRHVEVSKVLNLATCSRCDSDFLYRDLELPDENKYCPVCNFNRS